MSILTDAIAELTAGLEPVVTPPTGDLGFGSDLDCADDLTENMDELAGDDIRIVKQANYRRLRTPRGTLPDDPDYGLDIASFLHRGLTPQEKKSIPSQVRAELLKDDRNEGTLTVTPTWNADGFDLDIHGETALGPYSQTLSVTDAGVLMKEIS